MVLLFGVAVSFFVNRFDRYVPPFFTRSSTTVFGYLMIAGLCAFGLSQTVPAINGIV